MAFFLQGLTLHFVVLSFDRYSRDDVIGEVMLELESLDLSNSDNNPLPIAREITPRSYKVLSCKSGLFRNLQVVFSNHATFCSLKAKGVEKF